jgi:hypothetical protein
VDHSVAEAAFIQQLKFCWDAVGKKCLPPPTATGVTNRWYSSTNPALIAWAARCGPPTLRSRPAAAFIILTASGSKCLSTRVLALKALSSVVE